MSIILSYNGRLVAFSCTVAPFAGILIGPKLSTFQSKVLLIGKILPSFLPGVSRVLVTEITFANAFSFLACFDNNEGLKEPK